MIQNAAKLAKIQVLYESGDIEINFALNIKVKVQILWPFLRMRNSKLSKEPMRRPYVVHLLIHIQNAT